MPRFTQPLWLRREDVTELPDGWSALPTEDAVVQIKPGKLYDNKSVVEGGTVPVLSQGESDFVGFHNDEPGVQASVGQPVVTFANHTCNMRLMKEPYSCIQNIFSKIGRKGVCNTVYFYYAAQRRVDLSGYKGHHPLFRQAYIPIPPLPAQHKIASILSAYDDLIENNTRRIAILEEMAQSIYREWFVNFRFPGHENTRFVESATGPMPEEWEVKNLSEVATVKGGKQLAKLKISDDGAFPVYGGNGIQGYCNENTHTGFVIAFGRVGAYCGSIHWSYRGAWMNNNSSSVVPLEYNELVLQHLIDFEFHNLRGGSAQPFISNSALSAIELVIPRRDIADLFCQRVFEIRMQQDMLIQKNGNLRKTRDLLLPKLVSGKLDVEDLDIDVGVAAEELAEATA